MAFPLLPLADLFKEIALALLCRTDWVKRVRKEARDCFSCRWKWRSEAWQLARELERRCQRVFYDNYSSYCKRLKILFLRWFYKVKINEVLICELRLQKQKIRKQMLSWTPRNLQTLQNLPLHFQIDLNKLLNFFSPIGSQVCLEQYFVGLKIWGPTPGSTCPPTQPWSSLQFPRNISSKQVPSPGLEWAVVRTAVQNSAKTLSNGVTTMQLKMVVAMLKYEPRDARSSYILIESMDQNV